MSFVLRPHHALCILSFCGRGYSDKFIANMYKIIGELENNPDIIVRSLPDSVCIACKNKVPVTDTNRAGCCFHDKVEKYDRAVLSKLNLPENSSISWNDLKTLVKEKIIVNGIADICSDCEWYDICEKLFK